MSILTADELFRFACVTARETFRELGKLYPTFLLQKSTGVLDVVSKPWRDGSDKRAALEAIRARCAEIKVTRMAFIREAWVSILPRERLPDVLAGNVTLPRYDPDRKEVVAVCVETIVPGEKNISGMMDIIRWYGKLPELSKVRTATVVQPPEFLPGE